ncbi:MAG: hypothetical protein WC989_04375 [Micavibrio sp.]
MPATKTAEDPAREIVRLTDAYLHSIGTRASEEKLSLLEKRLEEPCSDCPREIEARRFYQTLTQTF